MYHEARGRLADADILGRSVEAATSQSDSQQLLRILGFEVLLKCAIRLCSRNPIRTHNYVALWYQGLTDQVRDEVLHTAGERMKGRTDFTDMTQLLEGFRFVFEKARYYCERYDGWTLGHEREFGQPWEDHGAPTGEAEVQYYPNELDCLVAGLTDFIEARIGAA